MRDCVAAPSSDTSNNAENVLVLQLQPSQSGVFEQEGLDIL